MQGFILREDMAISLFQSYFPWFVLEEGVLCVPSGSSFSSISFWFFFLLSVNVIILLLEHSLAVPSLLLEMVIAPTTYKSSKKGS